MGREDSIKGMRFNQRCGIIGRNDKLPLKTYNNTFLISFNFNILDILS
jgi:hypothetical protein